MISGLIQRGLPNRRAGLLLPVSHRRAGPPASRAAASASCSTLLPCQDIAVAGTRVPRQRTTEPRQCPCCEAYPVGFRQLLETFLLGYYTPTNNDLKKKEKGKKKPGQFEGYLEQAFKNEKIHRRACYVLHTQTLCCLPRPQSLPRWPILHIEAGLTALISAAVSVVPDQALLFI